MTKKLMKAFSAAALVLMSIQISYAADEYRNKTVHIECTNQSGAKVFGSGVIVSEKGHIVTAKHVVEGSDRCRASVGHVDSNKKRILLRARHSMYDAALLQFVDNKEYEFMRYCELDDSLYGKNILSAGYPKNSDTGNLSTRAGIISTIIGDRKGLVETTALTTGSQSGGPVMLGSSGDLIGIIVGARFDGLGQPDSYGVLPIESVSSQFEFHSFDNKSDTGCTGQRASETHTWKSISSEKVDIDLKMSVGEGFCFFTGHAGIHNSEFDTARIVKQNGKYRLLGMNEDGGKKSHEITCEYYN